MEARDLRLRFVEAGSILLHEESDPARVNRLTAAVLRDGFLRNPPIVSQMPDGNMVVLDGATRTTMLKNLGASFIPVQLVPYNSREVTLGAWYHVLPHKAAVESELFARTHQAEVIPDVPLETALRMLENREGIAAIVRDTGQCFVFSLPTRAFDSSFSVLRALVAVYGGAGEIYRIVHEDLVEIVQNESSCPDVVMFPTFKPEEIMRAAREGDLLPAGITRHLINGRVLNMNIPLQSILSPGDGDAKNADLSSWLTQKILDKKVRYYHEPVFVFDD